MKKPESTLSYDRCVPVFCCFVAAFYFADALILLTLYTAVTFISFMLTRFIFITSSSA